jgi:hypothetical protein
MKWIVKSSIGKWMTDFLRVATDATMTSLKKVQGKKKRDAEAAEALKRKLAIEAEPAKPVSEQADDEPTANLLATKDDDVIF